MVYLVEYCPHDRWAPFCILVIEPFAPRAPAGLPTGWGLVERDRDGWSVHLHGGYGGIDEAMEAMRKRFPHAEPAESEYVADCPLLCGLAFYRTPRLNSLSFDDTYEWLLEAMESEIKPSTTDNEIQCFIGRQREEAAADDYSLHPSAYYIVWHHREDLREALALRPRCPGPLKIQDRWV